MVERYDWLSLGPGEALVWSGGPRLRRLLPVVAVAGPWTIGWFAVAVLAVQGGLEPIRLIAGGSLIAALVGVGVLTVAYFHTVATDYVLTTRNVYRKTGILSTSVSRVGIEAIQNTQLKKHVLGAIFDYGTVAISTAGSTGVDLRLTDLDDPETMRAALRERLTAVHRGGDQSASRLEGQPAATIGAEVRALRAAAERLEREVTGS